MIAKNLKANNVKLDRLNKELLSAEGHLTTTETRYHNSRKKETVKLKAGAWVAKWDCLPSNLMSEYQDSKVNIMFT